ncbi:MAG: hypothetical protein M3Z64_01375 [Verrucomicrobiota bacterium]|nr:hypothetical protein [Verrucomicrobiota bacterium]
MANADHVTQDGALSGTGERELCGPRLFPVVLVLSAILWCFTMTGGRHVFVPEVLSAAYDSQGEHLLRGEAEVDGDAIRHEAIIVNGKAQMYFGPFPAFLRIPLNLIYPAGRGSWSRLSGFGAGVVALAAFAALIGAALGRTSLCLRWQAWLGNASLVGFAFASPLLFLLGNLSIYNEAVVWGFAWSVAALFFVQRARETEGRLLTGALLAFSSCAGAALLSRVTFGVPFLFIAPLLAWELRSRNRGLRCAALFIPLGLALMFQFLLSYARFGTFAGISYENYINPVHREFVRQFGIFNLGRVPWSFADYFGFEFPRLESAAPFLRAARHGYAFPKLYSLPFSEAFLPVTWCSSWLLLGAIPGLVILFRRGRVAPLDRAIAGAFIVECLLVLSFHALAQRYAADLYPFLIFCFLVFLRNAKMLVPFRYLLVALVTFSVLVNSLATVSWLVDADQNVPAETRAAWKMFLAPRSVTR